ncbi:MAG: RloB domain-containing protein, partial [Clostridiales bacterium]
MRKRISKAKIGQRNYTSSSVDPKKLIVIAFEGNLTELEYFSGIKEFRDEIGLHSLIEIEMLDRIDTRSDPESVKKLVEEYENNPFSKEIFDCLRRSDLCETLDEAGILLEDFMHDKLDDSKKEKFMVAANCANLSIELNDTKEKYAIDNKELWIVIDKDRNSEYSLKTFISDCKYNIVLSNPCFELWLLLHLTNIDEYNKNDLLENNKISKNHRFISKEISD